MPSINSVTLAGYCEGDPRTMGASGNVISLRLRIHELVRKRDGGRFLKTEYVTVKAFGETTDYVGLNVADGTGILVQGRIRTERWGEGERAKKETIVVADRIQVTGISEDDELLEMGFGPDGEVAPADAEGRVSAQAPKADSGSRLENAGTEQEPPSEALERNAEVTGEVHMARVDSEPVEAGEQPPQVQIPDPGSPEFEQLKGIQRVPW